MTTVHKTVLLKETIDVLDLKPHDVVVDATLNAGGHTKEVLTQEPKAMVFGFDADEEAISRAKQTLREFPQVSFILSNFKHIKHELEERKVKEVDKFIFDLGLSSDQLETSGRGFSFKRDEPLLMTFSKNPKEDELTATDVVNSFSKESLFAIIKGFGEERFTTRIVNAILETREKTPITTSKQLADIIYNAVPAVARRAKTHPATKTFQAIRIAVNAELDVLKQSLVDAFTLLKAGGRIAVITFHSLEDRIVKHYFKELKEASQAILITKKPIISTEEELKANPRARSAKLRVIEKI